MKRSNLGLLRMALVVATMLMTVGCAGGKRLINNRGLKFAMIGDPMPPAGAMKYKGMPMRDSLAIQGEFEWRVSRLTMKGGVVYLEEDFFLHEGINRIRIETDQLQLANGLRVGMTVADLRNSMGPWHIAPLRDHGLFDFYTRLLPGIHFLVKDPSHGMEDIEWEKYLVENFDSAAKIVAIVVY